MTSTLTPRQQKVADRKAAGVWLTIPYELADVRAKAKASGALWQPGRKQWSVPAEAAERLKKLLGEVEGADVKTFHFNDFYMASSFVSGRASELGNVYDGDIARDRDGAAWAVVSRVDRRRFEEENEEWYTDSTIKARPATEEEAAALDAKEAAEAVRKAGIEANRVQLAASAAVLKAAEEGAERVPRDLPLEGRAECLTIESIAYGSMHGVATYAYIENDSESPRRVVIHGYNADWDAVSETMVPVTWTQELDDALRVMARSVELARALG
jgi:hypothetical protein